VYDAQLEEFMIDEKVKSPTYPGKPSTQRVLEQEVHSAPPATEAGCGTKKNNHKTHSANPAADHSRWSFLGKAGGLTAWQ
jgi:hypothetical protein